MSIQYCSYCNKGIDTDIDAEHFDCGDRFKCAVDEEDNIDKTTLTPDLVNHPPHYTKGGIEAKDAIRAALTVEEYRGYIKGNCIKYVWREKHKGGDEDLGKVGFYINDLLNKE